MSGPSWPPAISVIRMAAQFSTHGTDRSMPPPMMTKVWPRATMPMKAASTDIERRCEPERKPGENTLVRSRSTIMPR